MLGYFKVFKLLDEYHLLLKIDIYLCIQDSFVLQQSVKLLDENIIIYTLLFTANKINYDRLYMYTNYN